jgi:hypothetical protein
MGPRHPLVVRRSPNQRGLLIKAAPLFKPNTIVVSVPYHLKS